MADCKNATVRVAQFTVPSKIGQQIEHDQSLAEINTTALNALRLCVSTGGWCDCPAQALAPQSAEWSTTGYTPNFLPVSYTHLRAHETEADL
eukprot:2645130-Amphidinium_carterae.1